MILDYVKLVITNLANRKLRSLLTIIGIFIGIAAVVSLLSIGQGVNFAIREQFEKMGADKIVVLPASAGQGFVSATAAPKPLTEKDVEKISKIRDVDVAIGVIFKSARISFGKETKYGFVMGIPLDETKEIVKSMQQFEIEKGKDLEKEDKYEAVVGHDFAYELFKRRIKPGDEIEIEGKKFKVVGILEKIGNRMDDACVVISRKIARDMFKIEDEVSLIFVKVKKGMDVNLVADEIKEKLRKFRNEEEGKESFQVQTSAQLMERVQTILSIFQIMLVGIAAISLLVGGIGIMNTQYTSVLERTREIGIMKAIGASNLDIMLIFLMEAGMIGLIGGVIGCILGICMAKLIEVYATTLGLNMLKAYVDFTLIFGALLFSFFIGTISGFAPARRAARLQPAEALRYE